MRLFSLFLLCGIPLGSLAQTTSYGVIYDAGYTQVSDLAPAPSTAWSFQAAVQAATAGTYVSGNLTSPVQGTQPMDPADGSILYLLGGYWSSSSELLASYPVGNYQFDIVPVTGPPATGFLTYASLEFPNTVPMLTGGSWSALQGVAPNVPIAISWPTFTVAGPASTRTTTLQIQDYVTPSNIFSEAGDADTYVGTTIPATSLLPGRFYGLNLSFSSTRSTNIGFGVPSYTTARRTVGTTFKALAVPGTVSGNLNLMGHVNPSTKTYTAEILDAMGNVLETQSFSVGYGSWYAFDTTLTGVVDIRFDADGFLSKVMTGVDLGVGQDFLDVTLFNGDVNEDGEIGPLDFSLLALAFGSFPGDPNYSFEADLDGNGEVGPADFSLMAIGFGNFDE